MKEVLVKKLISLGVVLALLVTFMVPVIAGAEEDCRVYKPPACPELPDKTTRTLAGGVVWTTLASIDIMGNAVALTTGMLACNLGGWSDELGIILTESSGVLMQGLGELLPEIGDMIGMRPLFEALGAMLVELGRVFAEFNAG